MKLAQTHLQTLGYYPGPLDGIFGPLTEEAVRAFQQSYNLPVDGIIRSGTHQKLQSLASQQNTSSPAARRIQLDTQIATNRAFTSAPETIFNLEGPVFTPAVVPQLNFHPLEVAPDDSSAKIVWITVLTLVAVGGVTFYFKPDKKTPASGPLDSGRRAKSTTIHRPQPVYPKVYRKTQPQVIHRPQPVYPTGRRPQENVEASADKVTPTGPHVLELHEPQLTPTSPAEASKVPKPEVQPLQTAVAERIEQQSIDYALQQLARQTPWASQSSEKYLPSFLYDLQEAESREQLEGVVALMPTRRSPKAKILTASPKALMRRLGTFPELNRRTGDAYTYMLLDDMGGCFRMCNHELWLTETAMHWLSDNEPYTLTIRRIDTTGRTVDKAFTVKLNTHQMQMAS